jgi:protease IV
MLSVPFRVVLNLLVLVVRGLEWLLLWPFVLLRSRARRFVVFDLKQGFRLAPRPGLAGRLGTDPSYATFDGHLRRVEADRQVEGVLVRVLGPHVSPTDAALLQRRLLRARALGKRVVCFVESGGVTTMTIAAAADTVMMAPAGRLMMPGLAFELTFLRDLLRRLGLRAQFIHIGRYKTAGHVFTRRGPSRAQHRMMRLLLDDLGDTLGERLDRHSRGPEQRWPRWEEGPSLGPVQARRLGLIEQRAYPDQVRARLQAERAGDDFEPFATSGDEELAKLHRDKLAALPTVSIETPSQHALRRPKPLRLVPLFGGRPRIEVVEMSGVILPDEAVGGALGGRAHIAPGAVRRVFKALRVDRRVKAVVLAIDSRGGSALASDLIWREVRRLRQRKPVIAVMRSVAASGGYYIAVGADEILADEATLTGSIGVVAGKFSVGRALRRVDVRAATLTLGEHATLLSARHAWTKRDIDVLRADVRESYRRFVSRVALGRGMKARRVHLLARGRVYTGRQARAFGLVDGLGTVDDAIARAAERAGVSLERAQVGYRSLVKPTLRSLLTGAFVDAGEGAWLLPALGPLAEEVLPLLRLLNRDPVLAYFTGALLSGPD